MLVVCALTAVFAGPVIRFLYGGEFGLSTRVLQIMLPSVFSLAVAGSALAVPRRDRPAAPAARRLAGGVVLVVALSFALIPDHGAAGAAAALSIGNTVILAAIAATAYLYRNAEPRGPTDAGRAGARLADAR